MLPRTASQADNFADRYRNEGLQSLLHKICYSSTEFFFTTSMAIHAGSFSEKPFDKYRLNVHSQNGEDGVISQIFGQIGAKPPQQSWCVEFGAWDGKHLSNTFALVERGYNAVFIEGDTAKYHDLLKTVSDFPRIIPLGSTVESDPSSLNSLENLLRKTSVPYDFDLLSIDIDSFDLDVWEGFAGYEPNVVIIEINSSLSPGILHRHTGKRQGNSFSSTLEVARKKLYTLVCHTGNMIFVHSGLVKRLNIHPRFIEYPDLLFNDMWL